MNNKYGISYIVPVYNEEGSIGDTINRLHGILKTLVIPYEIIVVNDGSQDRTREIADQNKDITLISHPINTGYGNSLKTGIQKAQYDWIGIVDADGSYPIEDIPKLFNEMVKGFDMVIGLRENTAKIDKPVKRLLRWIFKIIIKLVIKEGIDDANCGFRIFKRNLAIDFFPFLCGTYSFTTSLTILAMGEGHFVKHVPIKYHPRNGNSKVRHLRDSLQTLQYIVQGITFFNPIKFFAILSFCMILTVYIPAMIFAVFRMHTLSLYYMIFGTTVTLLIALGVLGDIVRISLTRIVPNLSQRKENV